MKLFLFSGLGADYRAYSKIKFSEFKVVHIQWIIPQKDESIENYAKRLSIQINNDEPYIFIGLSFGGIMAIEVAKYCMPQKILLISSVKLDSEIPHYFKIFNKYKIYQLLPNKFLTTSNILVNYFFGIKGKGNRNLLSSILKESNPYFIRWAFDKIINWNSKSNNLKIIHIHGSADRIFPLKNIKSDFVIQSGGHFMIVEQASQVEKIIISSIRES